MADEAKWVEVERGWWRKLHKPGTACVINDVSGAGDFSASVFVRGFKVGDCSFTSLDEAQKWAERALFEAFTAVP